MTMPGNSFVRLDHFSASRRCIQFDLKKCWSLFGARTAARGPGNLVQREPRQPRVCLIDRSAGPSVVLFCHPWFRNLQSCRSVAVVFYSQRCFISILILSRAASGPFHGHGGFLLRSSSNDCLIVVISGRASNSLRDYHPHAKSSQSLY